MMRTGKIIGLCMIALTLPVGGEAAKPPFKPAHVPRPCHELLQNTLHIARQSLIQVHNEVLFLERAMQNPEGVPYPQALGEAFQNLAGSLASGLTMTGKSLPETVQQQGILEQNNDGFLIEIYHELFSDLAQTINGSDADRAAALAGELKWKIEQSGAWLELNQLNPQTSPSVVTADLALAGGFRRLRDAAARVSALIATQEPSSGETTADFREELQSAITALLIEGRDIWAAQQEALDGPGGTALERRLSQGPLWEAHRFMVIAGGNAGRAGLHLRYRSMALAYEKNPRYVGALLTGLKVLADSLVEDLNPAFGVSVRTQFDMARRFNRGFLYHWQRQPSGITEDAAAYALRRTDSELIRLAEDVAKDGTPRVLLNESGRLQAVVHEVEDDGASHIEFLRPGDSVLIRERGSNVALLASVDSLEVNPAGRILPEAHIIQALKMPEGTPAPSLTPHKYKMLSAAELRLTSVTTRRAVATAPPATLPKPNKNLN